MVNGFVFLFTERIVIFYSTLEAYLKENISHEKL